MADDFAIVACPGIYQALIEKSYEVRVTVFGDRVFAIKIDSQKDGETIDWRYDFLPGKQPIASIALLDEVADRCRAVCQLLSITFAAFDFIVDHEGEYIFLELNQAGQFLFAEHHAPEVTLLDAFTKFLTRTPADRWGEPTLHLKDYFVSSSYAALNALKRAEITLSTKS